ncbi:MAG: FemAB family PEP-CTERM system-associated protein [Acidobacteria bacterium]|nr:FemAB family PEP-CTERM system-associated protein [Acidobacteriota bacterium]
MNAYPVQISGTPDARSEVVKHSPITINYYSEADAARWDRYVKRAPAATFCHQSGWMDVVERTWHYRSLSLFAERKEEIIGVLPLFHVKSRWFGSMLVSTPNAVYGGAVADDAGISRALVLAAQELALELDVDYLELRDTGLTEDKLPDEKFRRRDLYVTFEHPIDSDEEGQESLMKSFPRDIRRMIRQGAKHGLSSEFGREELLDDFYDVYAVSVRNLGTPVYPKRLFAEFLRRFPNECDILVIRQAKRIAGGVMSFYFRDTVLPYFGGAYPEFYRTGVNNYMYWELMRSAATRGYRVFDFGRSKRGTGAYEFKRGWGMTERSLPYKYFLVRTGEMPNLNPTNPKFKLMIEAWKRLPLGVTKLIGPKIVRNLP